MRMTREFTIPAPYRSPFQRVAPGIHTLPGQSVGRVYILEDCDGLTLVDTGLGCRSRNLAKAVRSAGRALQDIRRVLLTHLHPDHVGGLHMLQVNSDFEIVTSLENAEVLRGQVRAVNDGGIVKCSLGGVTVIETPGHLRGHVSFWLPEHGVLFAGDTLASWGGLGILPRVLHHNATQVVRDVERLARLNPEVICCGHGPPITRNAAARLRTVARGVSS